jgi:hypothetical protein
MILTRASTCRVSGALAIDKEATRKNCSKSNDAAEGLWAFVASSIAKPRSLSHRGVLTLQGGRILGGHSYRAYAGTYEINEQMIRVRLETWLWNPLSNERSLFGVSSGYADIYSWTGNLDSVFMSGEITSEAAPGVQLAAAFMKVADLDGTY